jgi:hypothetical protein
MGLIDDMKIYGHGILYITTFIVLHNIVIDVSYSMLLEKPWLKDAKITHDWGNNTVTIQGNGMVRTIVVGRCKLWWFKNGKSPKSPYKWKY